MPADVMMLSRLLEREKEGRQQWLTIWQEVAELVMPNRATFTTDWADGQMRRRRILDDTAEQANEVWAQGMGANMMSRQTRWFHLGVRDSELARRRDVKVWLAEATDALYSNMNDPAARFYPATHQVLLDLGAFGSSILFMPERERRQGGGVAYQARFIGDAVLCESPYGVVDSVMFEQKWSMQDIVDEWGEEALPEKLAEEWRGEHCDRKTKKHMIVHTVMPRDDRAMGGDTSRSMAWASVWWMPAHKHVLRESGFREFPFAVPRLSKRTGEKYGVGHGIRKLHDIRMLQRMWETVIKAAQKAVDPPLMVPDDSFVGPVRTVPGGLNYFRPGTEDRIAPMETGTRVDIGVELLDAQRRLIERAFFNDVFDITADSTGVNVKATFVNSRRRDKLMRLSPIFSLLEPDLLDPVIARTYAVLARQGLLPEMPAALEGAQVDVVYQSAISRAQRGSEVEDIFGLFDVVAPIAESDPSILMNIDGDALVQHAGNELLNVSPKILRDPRVVAQMRQQMKQEQDIQQAAELAPGVAGALKDVSQAQAVAGGG
jgi:hypothetical protein